MAGRTVSVIGVKQILYGEPLEAAPTSKKFPMYIKVHMSLPKKTVQQQSIRTN